MNRFYIVLFVSITFNFFSLARVAVPGERLWNLQKLVTEASCDAIIAQADFTAGVKTISQNGVYALAESVIGKIVINADNVVLDLNGKTITNTSDSTVVVNGVAKCSILNGIVSATTGYGILASPGTSQLNIEYISANNCIEGIRLEDTVDALIENCELTLSTTGITLSNSSRISVLDTVALSNTDAGFSLFSSEKNLISNCKAVKTGDGQTNVAKNVYGFVSDDGQGNIFDSCVAQSTLATTVTAVSAVVASFALTGTETQSAILGCQSDFVQTGIQNGYAVPHGIWLQPQFDALVSVTAANQGIFGNRSAWHPDGAYLAIGGGEEFGPDEIKIYMFNRASGTLTFLDRASQGTSSTIVRWSPDGSYLASAGFVEGVDEIQIFSFNSTTGTITKTDGASQGSLGRWVSWTPDAAYFGTAGTTESGDEIQIFSFNSTTGTITKTDGVSQGTVGWAIAWSPDGMFCATGGESEGGDEIQIFSFNHVTGTITKIGGGNQGTGCYALAWSPNGEYLASAGEPEGGDEIQIFSFDSSTGTITKVDGANQGTAGFSVEWSQDMQYFLTAGRSQDGNEVQLFSFDRSSQTITLLDAVSQGSDVAVGASFSPDAAYICTTGRGEGGNEVQIFRALTFPTLNVLKNNIVHGASGGVSSALGVGIGGSSIENLIIGNSSYDNASFNYQFVTNVFDQRFDATTSDVQNISMKQQDPIYSP